MELAMTESSFRPAVKEQLKARVALAGPTGSGKTWTALEWASVLGKRIALIDTERRSGRLYANRFDFDVADFPPPYDPQRLKAMVLEADAAGYDVIIVDSLSHFWEGEGGVLDLVDAAAARNHNNTFVGWKTGTPVQRNLVDTLLGLDAHLIVTMRSKMEWILETNEKGKQAPRKIGMAPVQRAGIEYEFTLIGDMDYEHRITISKSRCDVLADKVVEPHRAGEAAALFAEWLEDGTPPPPPADATTMQQISDTAADLDERERATLNAWFKETGWSMAHLDAEQAGDVLAKMTAILSATVVAEVVVQAEPPCLDDADPAPAVADVELPDFDAIAEPAANGKAKVSK